MTTTPRRLHAIYYLAILAPPLDYMGVLLQEYSELPNSWLDALSFLIADLDNARCENDCGTSIGYAFDNDDLLQWRTSYLAKRDDHGIVRLCETCAPTCPTAPPAAWLPLTERTT